jgi:hypothetical protein
MMKIHAMDQATEQLNRLFSKLTRNYRSPESLEPLSKEYAILLADRIDEIHQVLGYSVTHAEEVDNGWIVVHRWQRAGTGTDRFPEGMVFGAAGGYYHI